MPVFSPKTSSTSPPDDEPSMKYSISRSVPFPSVRTAGEWGIGGEGGSEFRQDESVLLPNVEPEHECHGNAQKDERHNHFQEGEASCNPSSPN